MLRHLRLKTYIHTNSSPVYLPMLLKWEKWHASTHLSITVITANCACRTLKYQIQFPLCCNNNFHSSGNAIHYILELWLWGFPSLRQKISREFRHWSLDISHIMSSWPLLCVWGHYAPVIWELDSIEGNCNATSYSKDSRHMIMCFKSSHMHVVVRFPQTICYIMYELCRTS